MKQITTFLGFAGICVGCCAAVIIPPLLGAGALSVEWLSALTAILLAATFLAVGLWFCFRQ